MRSRTSTWFETKVKYQKTMEDGSEKVVSEAYVVDALSFTEAESAIIDEMSVYVSGELKVSGIGKACYGEIFFSDIDDRAPRRCEIFIPMCLSDRGKRSIVSLVFQSLSQRPEGIDHSGEADLSSNIYDVSATFVRDRIAIEKGAAELLQPAQKGVAK